ncbi:hypothetical protein CNR22_00010 [Sphingobacteriaceae bacterium]|nr:hypothetical protein CNR22_00010 [Sphingobacteriaceae bacterium]
MLLVPKILRIKLRKITKQVNADLTVAIDPQISGDEQITMVINVKQSTFTERINPSAPPGTINRDFQSLVRVRNGEMIMLGGLEETQTNRSGNGIPFLARIPVLRSFSVHIQNLNLKTSSRYLSNLL